MNPKHVVDILIAITSFITIIFSTIVYVKLTNLNFSNLSTIAENWIQGPLINIDLKCHNNSMPIIESEFQSTEDGCYCPSNINSDKSLIEVSQQDLNALYFKSLNCPDRCNKIQASPSLSYTGWKSYFFCANRMNVTYLDLIVVSSPSKCEELSKKSCGTIDTFNNVMCLDKKDECPLNFIMFANETMMNSTMNELKKLNVTASYLNLTEEDESVFEELLDPEERVKRNNTNYLIYTNNYTQGNIFNQFIVSENQPCAVSNEYQTPELFFPLNKITNQTCMSYINGTNLNQNYIILNTIKQKELYETNLMLDYFQQNLYYPQVLLNKNIHLFSRGYQGVTALCVAIFNKINGTPFLTTNQEILSKIKYFKSLFEAGVINPYSVCLIIIVLMTMLFVNILIKILICTNIEFENKLSTKVAKDLINSINFFLLIMAFIFGSISVAILNSSQSTYKFLVEYKFCLDSALSYKVSNFDYNLNFINITLVIETTIFLILSFFPMLFYIYEKCFNQKN